MKNILIILTIILFPALGFSQNSPAVTLATKISVRMKDSLSLSETQRQQIYSATLQLQSEKSAVWAQTSDTTVIQHNVQLLENSRDARYQAILTPEQYQLYLQKKKRLIANN